MRKNLQARSILSSYRSQEETSLSSCGHICTDLDIPIAGEVEEKEELKNLVKLEKLVTVNGAVCSNPLIFFNPLIVWSPCSTYKEIKWLICTSRNWKLSQSEISSKGAGPFLKISFSFRCFSHIFAIAKQLPGFSIISTISMLISLLSYAWI